MQGPGSPSKYANRLVIYKWLCRSTVSLPGSNHLHFCCLLLKERHFLSSLVLLPSPVLSRVFIHTCTHAHTHTHVHLKSNFPFPCGFSVKNTLNANFRYKFCSAVCKTDAFCSLSSHPGDVYQVSTAGHLKMAADNIKYPPRLRIVSLRRDSAKERKKMLSLSQFFI